MPGRKDHHRKNRSSTQPSLEQFASMLGLLGEVVGSKRRTARERCPEIKNLEQFFDDLNEQFPNEPRRVGSYVEMAGILKSDNLREYNFEALRKEVSDALDEKAASTGNHGNWQNRAARDDKPVER